MNNFVYNQLAAVGSRVCIIRISLHLPPLYLYTYLVPCCQKASTLMCGRMKFCTNFQHPECVNFIQTAQNKYRVWTCQLLIFKQSQQTKCDTNLSSEAFCRNWRASCRMQVIFRPTCRMGWFSSVWEKSNGQTYSGPTCFLPMIPERQMDYKLAMRIQNYDQKNQHWFDLPDKEDSSLQWPQMQTKFPREERGGAFTGNATLSPAE